LSDALKDAEEDIGDVIDRFEELRGAISEPILTSAEATVFAEGLLARAEAIANSTGGVGGMTGAEKTVEFVGAANSLVQNLQAMGDAGLPISEIQEFMDTAINNLLVLGRTMGVSAADEAAMITMMQQAIKILNGGMDEFDALFADLALVYTPTMVDGVVGAGGVVTNNVSINLPPGIDAQQVIDAMEDYAATQGATVQAPFQFVNV